MSKIVLLNGSPRKNGNTAKLADAFTKGAEAAGHEVTKFSVVDTKVNGCIACEHCIRNEGRCVQKDGMQEIYAALYQSDTVVFATPVYFFGMSAQIKAIIDQYHEDTPEKEKARVILTRCQSHELNRQELSHKEKARMYKQMKDSYITLGYRDPVARVAGTSPDKLKTVSRHIQVAELTDALLDMIVDKQIEFMAGHEISFFRDKSHFDCLHDFLADHPQLKVKKKAAEELRNLEAVTPLTYQLLDSFFFPQKLDTPTAPSTVDAITLKFSELPFDTDGLTKEEIKQKVLDVLSISKKHNEREGKP